jgi:Ca-activated chloride channel family protein
MEAAVQAFAAKNMRTSSGSPIEIKVTGVLSGDSMQQILDGRLKPVAWSPGEVSWIDQFRTRWKQSHSRPAIADACPATVYSPMGIAMWRPMAEALGWPAKKISWRTIIDLAGDQEGWARYGHPEWGSFKLGYPHPQYSSAGFLFLTSAIYATAGKTSGLTSGLVYEPAVEKSLVALAHNTSKYGLLSTELLTLMAQQGPAFLHAVSAFEEGAVRLNVERASELRWPIVFVFPQEGTFWGDHPFCILDGADWVTPEQQEAARLFRDFLLGGEMQSQAVKNYLRPVDPRLPIASPLSAENGTDPDATPQNVPALAIPDANTSAAIIDQFLVTKRKATILLVLDVSGSMSGASMRAAIESTNAFLRRLYPQDRVGLYIFNDKITKLSDVAQVSVSAEALSRQVLNLMAGGGTNLHGAVCAAEAAMNEIRKSDRLAAENRLYGIVVLSDGADTTGSISEGRMFETCLPSGPESDGTKVFTIAFGDQANKPLLARIASVTGGGMFAADASSIDTAYVRISAEQ